MGKLTMKQTRVIGDAFIDYLERKEMLKEIPKPELKTIYNKDFRREVTNLQYRACFGQVLYNLRRYSPSRIKIKLGIVYFLTSENSWNRQVYLHIYRPNQLKSL